LINVSVYLTVLQTEMADYHEFKHTDVEYSPSTTRIYISFCGWGSWL